MRLSRSEDATSLNGRQITQLAAYTKEIRQTPQADAAICYVANLRKLLTPQRESPFAFSLHCPRNSRRGKSRIVGMADSWCPRILSTEFSVNMLEFFHGSPMFEWFLQMRKHVWNFNEIEQLEALLLPFDVCFSLRTCSCKSSSGLATPVSFSMIPFTNSTLFMGHTPTWSPGS